jgi:ATP/maltotriose-dependent transcriptional regulator MalT
MISLSSEFFRVHRLANLRIGNYGTSTIERKKLRALGFELIEFEDSISTYSDIAIKARISEINQRYEISDLRLNAEKFGNTSKNAFERKLTKKELEILNLLPAGLSIRQMSGRLFLSESTVKTHLSSIYRKLEVSNRVQAISRGRELRLLTL